ncbi:hypothetical protein GW626_07595 [Peribacillus muralis]|uniref:hypothetical protein n=1 Tax=Peribacillus muralis TaxID=264697 RepID=UPI001F4EADC4|nr:hypothetical protein [Peribacillus muralis]MCK1992495.1 hypothetical protein [Peribacillus muralis]MCK2013051.1 hypothetical protein [Peribacillus muralis]
MQSITSGQPASSPIEMQGAASLKTGQILFGKVNKIFPNRMAEVQIGDQRMIATLDIPLRTGERYWLQVQQQNEGKLVLRALESPDVNYSNLKGAAAQLIAHLGVTSDPDAAKLAEYFLKNRLPITKETIQSALQWLKAADSLETGLHILKTMFAQQLPIGKEVFDALLAQVKGVPFHKLLSSLQQQLQAIGSKTETSVKLLAVLDSLHVTSKSRIQQTGLQQLVSSWLGSHSTSELKSGAFSLLQKTGFIPKGMTEAFFLNHLMDEAHAREGFPNHPVVDKLHQGLQLLSSVKSGALGTLEKAENEFQRPIVQGGARTPADFQQVPKKNISSVPIYPPSFRLLENAFAEATAGRKAVGANMAVKDLLAYLNGDEKQLVEAKGKAAEMILQSLKQHPEALTYSSNEKLVLTHVLEAEYQAVNFANGTAVAHQLKEVTKLLGLQLEHALINQSADDMAENPQDLETLKPLLLKLLNEQTPATTKEMAEQLLNRITAQQILSQENGPVQNLLLTLPLNLGGAQTDLTLQWSGRKTKDGSIDPDYCRVLFYLELEGIKETVIDMQVQNRVIKVTVINEHVAHLKGAANLYLDLLRGNLEKMDYRLSGVSFVNPKHECNGGKGLMPFSEAGSYNGVDIKI